VPTGDRVQQVGILSTGLYWPEGVRRNDWWPEATVERWRQQARAGLLSSRSDLTDLPEGARRTLLAMAEYEDDPFAGAVERRIMPEGMVASDMEVAAARDAIARAGVEPGEIGLLMVANSLPDYLSVPTAPRVHRELGLPPRCFSLAVDASSDSFPKQLALAERMLQGGTPRYALLVQSCGSVHLTRQQDPHSAWFGDMATAQVVGGVGAGRGLLAQAHFTEGEYYEALVTGVPGERWYEGKAAPHTYVAQPPVARKMLLNVVEMGRQAVHAALRQAGHAPEEVDFYACHQATAWFRKVTQAHSGMEKARFVDFFPRAASVGASNIPLSLALGEREGLLKQGDLVATYAGGSGVTWSSVVLRWGN
jgi:3-oxoacyl-[acyl-carrier-protein] synthase-3